MFRLLTKPFAQIPSCAATTAAESSASPVASATVVCIHDGILLDPSSGESVLVLLCLGILAAAPLSSIFIAMSLEAHLKMKFLAFCSLTPYSLHLCNCSWYLTFPPCIDWRNQDHTPIFRTFAPCVSLRVALAATNTLDLVSWSL